MTYVRTARPAVALLAVLTCVLAVSFGVCEEALADGPQIATATAQNIYSPVSGLSIIWHGKPVSALPFRIRLLDQASPLAYSLDINRPVAYGDSWTGISLGAPNQPEARSVSSIGIADPLLAEAIARGDTPSGKPANLATRDLEAAARQVAIWSLTNGIKLTPQTVPNTALRQRALQLAARAPGIQVPLQTASHSVQIFVRDTTANTVELAVTVALDPNTSSTARQHIDLYLDGVRCPILTQALTRIRQRSDGSYYAGQPTRLNPKNNAIDVADVDLARNTKVVDATANWVNVTSDPGLVMGGADAAPPLVTAEPAVLNFTTTTQLNPADYADPEQLLNNVGVAFLTTLNGFLVWVVLLAALYLIPRVGRMIDAGILRLFRRFRRKAPQVNPSDVEVEAPSEDEAVRIGLAALNLATPDEVVINVVQASSQRPPGTGTPARVRLTRRHTLTSK